MNNIIKNLVVPMVFAVLIVAAYNDYRNTSPIYVTPEQAQAYEEARQLELDAAFIHFGF